MTVDNFIDLLPAGFTYYQMSIDGDLTEAPTTSAIFIDGVERHQLTWDSGYVPATLAQAIQPTIDELQEIVDANPGTPLEDKLEDAIEKLETSVVEHAKPDYFATIGALGVATGDLQAAIDAGLYDPEQQLIDIMDYITGISRVIADGTLIQSIADSIDPVLIAGAQQALADGDALRAAGQYEFANTKYIQVLGFLPFYLVDEFPGEDTNPDFVVPPGESRTLKYSTVANITRGHYWSDLVVNFAAWSIEDIYTWPTALVSVNDVFSVTGSDGSGNVSLIDQVVWSEGSTVEVRSWTLP